MDRQRHEGPLHDPAVIHTDLVPDNFDWLSIKLKNRRISVGKSKVDQRLVVFMKRLGEETEPAVVWLCFGLTPKAASALGSLLLKQTT